MCFAEVAPLQKLVTNTDIYGEDFKNHVELGTVLPVTPGCETFFSLVFYSTPIPENSSHSYTKTTRDLIGGIHVKRERVFRYRGGVKDERKKSLTARCNRWNCPGLYLR